MELSLHSLPQPTVSVSRYSDEQQLLLVAYCLHRNGLSHTLSVLQHEAPARGLCASAQLGFAGASGSSLDEHVALCLAQLRGEAVGDGAPNAAGAPRTYEMAVGADAAVPQAAAAPGDARAHARADRHGECRAARACCGG
jgi:hypothetical protein